MFIIQFFYIELYIKILCQYVKTLTQILSIYKNNLCILIQFHLNDHVYLDLYKPSLNIFKIAKNIK